MPLLEEVIDAHGGLPRWREVEEISARVRTGGLLMASKGPGRSRFSDNALAATSGHQSAVFQDYPRPGRTGIFDRGSSRLLAADGAVDAVRERARDAFSGRSGLRRKIWWDDLDALYFAGYAMWQYLTAPFLLASDGFEAEEGEGMDVDGEHWRRLDVRFPECLDAHCREQRFYFDSEGMLRRHDYTAEVVASIANACHFSYEPRTFDGLVFPTRRRVVPRGPGGRPLPGPTIVSIELDSIRVS